MDHVLLIVTKFEVLRQEGESVLADCHDCRMPNSVMRQKGEEKGVEIEKEEVF